MIRIVPDDEVESVITACLDAMQLEDALTHVCRDLSDELNIGETLFAKCVKTNGGECIGAEAHTVEPAQCGRERQELRHVLEEPCTRGLHLRVKSLLVRPAQLLHRRLGRKRAASNLSDDAGGCGAPESKRAKPMPSVKPRRFLRVGKRLLGRRDREPLGMPSQPVAV